jgi:hypothetical protein
MYVIYDNDYCKYIVLYISINYYIICTVPYTYWAIFHHSYYLLFLYDFYLYIILLFLNNILSSFNTSFINTLLNILLFIYIISIFILTIIHQFHLYHFISINSYTNNLLYHNNHYDEFIKFIL